MGIQGMFNCVLLLWGSMFSAVAALYFWSAKNYEKEQRKWMIWMQLSSAGMLLSDALANIFDGTPGLLGWWMVRITNFVLFLLTDTTMLLFTRYLCVCLLSKEETARFRRVQVARFVGWLGVALVVLNQFTGIYYTFDAANVYHRSALFWVSLTIPVGCMLADSSLLLQYQHRISPRQLAAIGSYIVLPLVGASIQTVHYGWSLISLTVGVSMILMFLVSTTEQNEELLRLETNHAQLAEKLEIATVLNRCVEKLSSGGQNLDKATNELLGVISDYFAADRSYIFELDRARDVIINTHEAVQDGVTEEKDNLQEVPLQAVTEWIEAFEREGVYFLPDLEREKGKLIYDVLAPQNIHSLLAVPLMRDHVVTGFLGVDNPKEHYEDATLLSSLQFFVTNSLEQKKMQERLYRLSYTDMLTGLSNRNRYIEDLESHRGTRLEQVGGIYMDLNGLKRCNDRFGHAAGDALIRRAADALNEVFPGRACRIGGDEFVVVLHPVLQAQFDAKVQQLRAALVRHGVDAAVGTVWKQEVEDLSAFLREADDRMYKEKEERK